MERNFIKILKEVWKSNNSLVCVGLDPDVEKIPAFLNGKEFPLFEFNRAIIDATNDLVCAYKPQVAYYSAIAAENQLEMTIRYIHEKYPDIPVILDAKRGDIGSTASMYAKEVFDRYKADAVTVNPFMGGDTLLPFLSRKEKGIVILCKTSNPGSGDIQKLKVSGEEIYKKVARLANDKWNSNGNVILVVGATFPEEIKNIRDIAREIPFLTPGIGAQGGDVEKVVKNGKTDNGTGLIINSSRAIIYASDSESYAEAARQKTIELKELINLYR